MVDNPKNKDALIVLTRMLTQSEATKKAILRRNPNARVLIAPVRQLVHFEHVHEDLSEYPLVIVSSPLVLDLVPVWENVPVAVIGAKTAQRLSARGARLVMLEKTAQDLCARLKSCSLTDIIYLRGDPISLNFRAELGHARVQEKIIYKITDAYWSQEMLDALRSSDRLVFPVYSHETGRALVTALGASGLASIEILPFSQKIAQIFEGMKCHAPPDVPDGTLMLDLLLAHVQMGHRPHI